MTLYSVSVNKCSVNQPLTDGSVVHKRVLASAELRRKFESEVSPEAFWSRVDRGLDSECWMWLGPTGWRGHGTTGVPGLRGPVYVHRVAWALTHGAISAGVSICHSCDTPACCNPAHLYPGNQLTNMRDASARGRLSGPRCRPHYALPDRILDEIRALAPYPRRRGALRLLAQRRGIDFSTVYRRAAQFLREGEHV